MTVITDKLEVDGALILPLPISINVPFKGIYSYSKLHRKEKKLKKDMMSPEIELGISRTEGHELTNYCLLQASFFYSGAKIWNALLQFFLYLTLFIFLNWWFNMSK